MKVVQTKGISMRPILVTGDLVVITEKIEPIPFGTLVYAKTINQEMVIHRYVGQNLVKGDRVKNFDQIESIEGIVTSRIFKNKELDLNTVGQKLLMGSLNLLNQKKFIFIHHFAAGFIALFGKVFRKP